MIRCIPKGIFTNSFVLTSEHERGQLSFHWLRQEGSLNIDGVDYEIRKTGIFNPEWTLERNGTTLLQAQRRGLVGRALTLTNTAGEVTILERGSVWRREMLLRGEGWAATITPDHAFTYRSTISGEPANFRLACFAFWLTVMRWRRAAQQG